MELVVKAYSIDEHPNKDAVFEWVRNNWHDLADVDIDDIVNSLKALADVTGGKLDYALSSVPDRGEFVRFTEFDPEIPSALIFFMFS